MALQSASGGQVQSKPLFTTQHHASTQTDCPSCCSALFWQLQHVQRKLAATERRLQQALERPPEATAHQPSPLPVKEEPASHEHSPAPMFEFVDVMNQCDAGAPSNDTGDLVATRVEENQGTSEARADDTDGLVESQCAAEATVDNIPECMVTLDVDESEGTAEARFDDGFEMPVEPGPEGCQGTTKACPEDASESPALPSERVLPAPARKETDAQQQLNQDRLNEKDSKTSVAKTTKVSAEPTAAQHQPAAVPVAPVLARAAIPGPIILMPLEGADISYLVAVGSGTAKKKEVKDREGKRICWQCPARFQRWSQLHRHTAAEHPGTKPHRCMQCDQTFTNPSTLRVHIQAVHLKLQPHQCQYCGRRFAELTHLRVHLHIHTGHRPHTCSYCGKGFIQLGGLRIHEAVHRKVRPHQCPDCGRGFGHPSLLQQHQRIVHEGHAYQSSQNRKQQCTVCGHCFRFNCQLLEHMSVHTGDRPFVCDECGARFRLSSGLRIHKRRHSGPGQFYLCHTCGKGFHDASNYRNHVALHSDARPYLCHSCGRTFRSLCNLKEHMQRHQQPQEERGNAGDASGVDIAPAVPSGPIDK